MIMKGGYGAGVTDADGNIVEPLASLLTYWELDPADFKGRPEDTREALQRAKRALGPDKGYSHYATVPDEQLTDAFHYTLFPNFAVSLWADGFHFLRARPHPTDPEQCLFDNWWYASPASVAAELDDGTSATESLTADGSGDVPVKWLTCGEGLHRPGDRRRCSGVYHPAARCALTRASQALISQARKSASAVTTSASMTTSMARL